MTKSTVLLLGSVALWALSFYVLSNSGLALVLDVATGEKYCISRLPGFLGVAEDSWVLMPVEIATMAGFCLLPLIPLGMLARRNWDKLNARKQASPGAAGANQGRTL